MVWELYHEGDNIAQRPSRPCASPRCPKLVREGRYCDDHKEQDTRKRYDRARGTRQERGYGQVWYQGIRPAILLRDKYQCQACGCFVGMRKGDAHVDHIVSKERGGSDEETNLQTLCASCHSEKTIAEDGGFGAVGIPK